MLGAQHQILLTVRRHILHLHTIVVDADQLMYHRLVGPLVQKWGDRILISLHNHQHTVRLAAFKQNILTYESLAELVRQSMGIS